jgi:peptidoglycan/xylan/chitin deacetylase (PgdA/CDA1 family)
VKNLILIQPYAVLRKIYPKAVWRMGLHEKAVYLTFDDGPIPGLTEWVLDELKKFNAKATFFCVGENILKNPAVFERVKNEGHQVGNHTMRHIKGFKHSVADYMREAEACKELVGNTLFRPPYGQLKRAQYRALIARGYKIVMWDVISYDFEPITEKKCAENVIKNSKKGSVILFHDNVKAEKNMKYALPLFLEHCVQQGYTFKTL